MYISTHAHMYTPMSILIRFIYPAIWNIFKVDVFTFHEYKRSAIFLIVPLYCFALEIIAQGSTVSYLVGNVFDSIEFLVCLDEPNFSQDRFGCTTARGLFIFWMLLQSIWSDMILFEDIEHWVKMHSNTVDKHFRIALYIRKRRQKKTEYEIRSFERWNWENTQTSKDHRNLWLSLTCSPKTGVTRILVQKVRCNQWKNTLSIEFLPGPDNP